MRPFVNILIILVLLASRVAAQHIVVTENFVDTELQDALKTIRKNYGVKIAYDNQLVENIRVTRKFDNVPLTSALEQLLVGTGLGHRFLNEKVIIIPNPKSAVNVTP